jgi:hypothetical protein
MYRSTGSSGFRVGFYGPDWYMVAFSNDWLDANITEDTKYDLDLKIGNNPWTIAATAFSLGNLKVLGFHTRQTDFFKQLVSNESLTVSQSGKLVADYNVSGAKDALAAMLTCQESHNHNPPKQS